MRGVHQGMSVIICINLKENFCTFVNGDNLAVTFFLLNMYNAYFKRLMYVFLLENVDVVFL